MTDQANQAAQVKPSYKIEGDDQAQDLKASENQSVDSATTNEVDSNNEQSASEPAADGFQKRINKVTADRYAETRRADALQKEIDELKAANPANVLTEPTLEDPSIDYDEDKLRSAQIAYQVQEGVRTGLANQATERELSDQRAAAQKVTNSFNERVTALGKEDFNEKANAVPQLPQGVADALMQSDNGPELIYHLGQHLDQADALAQMTPAAAMMELGRMQSTMTANKKIEPSAAPDPISPLSSGGAINAERGPAGATYE